MKVSWWKCLHLVCSDWITYLTHHFGRDFPEEYKTQPVATCINRILLLRTLIRSPFWPPVTRILQKSFESPVPFCKCTKPLQSSEAEQQWSPVQHLISSNETARFLYLTTIAMPTMNCFFKSFFWGPLIWTHYHRPTPRSPLFPSKDTRWLAQKDSSHNV